MSTNSDKRLIEDYLPIEAISAEASREKSVRKGHISTLHLWWARRPLVACRAAIYGALVPASRFIPEGAAEQEKTAGRENAADFVKRLCKYPGEPKVIAEAQQHILEAHAERLTQEAGSPVTVEGIKAGRAPRPKVLDMFAGGGSIPLEALRLGCEACALDLNPVAYIIELCTLDYPQQYGNPDPNGRGMTGSKNERGETTWGGLAEEVRYWGRSVLKKVEAEIGDLYPPIPDPGYSNKLAQEAPKLFKDSHEVPPGFLTPVAYLWTRTVTCKNPTCKATVPLVKQSWLCKKSGRYVALRAVAPKREKRVRFQVVESITQRGLGFDPDVGSKGGNATCPFCGTVADSEYVMTEGISKRIGQQMMAAVCLRQGRRGRLFISADDYPGMIPDDALICRRIDSIKSRAGLSAPNEVINPARPSPNSRGLSPVTRYGLMEFSDLFNHRQLYCLLSFASQIRETFDELVKWVPRDHAIAIVTYLSLVLDRVADWNSNLCAWSPENTGGAKIGHTFGRQALPMVWDYVESAVWGEATGSADLCLDWVIKGLKESVVSESNSKVVRGSATSLPWPDNSFDAVVTDPPYYDNVLSVGRGRNFQRFSGTGWRGA
jgi:putative DNA methylase